MGPMPRLSDTRKPRWLIFGWGFKYGHSSIQRTNLRKRRLAYWALMIAPCLRGQTFAFRISSRGNSGDAYHNPSGRSLK